MVTQMPITMPTVTGRTVSEMIVDELAQWGVRQIFGVQGHTILGILDAIRRQDTISYLEVRHEEAAGLMASAAAKLTGRLSVCIASAGPGVSNLLTGLLDAEADDAPVLALCGQEPRSTIGRGAYQAIDQHAMFETTSHFNHDIMDPNQTPELIMLACKAAIERRGVSRIGIPCDVERLMVSGPILGPAGHLVEERWAAPPQRIVEAVKMLTEAKRPVILVGRGLRDGREVVTRCAEIFDAPIVTSCPAKGIVPWDFDLSIGVVGRFGTPVADEIVRRSDVLLVVGSSLSENTTEGWTLIPSGTQIIQIDVNSFNIGRNYPVALPMVGDAFLTLDQINRQASPMKRPDYRRELHDLKRDWIVRVDQKAQSDAVPILPQRVIRELAETCDDDAIIALDVGDHAVFFCQQFPIRNQTPLVSGRMGVMGFGLPAANAARLACPNRQCIALCGDGGFSSIMGEFMTSCQYQLPITVVLMNNNELGMTLSEQEHEHLQPPGFFTSLKNCDYAAFASACGAVGIRVSKPLDLRPALEKAFGAGVPSLVQVDVDPKERPWFGT